MFDLSRLMSTFREDSQTLYQYDNPPDMRSRRCSANYGAAKRRNSRKEISERNNVCYEHHESASAVQTITLRRLPAPNLNPAPTALRRPGGAPPGPRAYVPPRGPPRK